MEYGSILRIYTNLGVSIGTIDTITQKYDHVLYQGFLSNNEGEFDILQFSDRLAGSVHWNSHIQRKHMFTSSFITRIEL